MIPKANLQQLESIYQDLETARTLRGFYRRAEALPFLSAAAKKMKAMGAAAPNIDAEEDAFAEELYSRYEDLFRSIRKRHRSNAEKNILKAVPAVLMLLLLAAAAAFAVYAANLQKFGLSSEYSADGKILGSGVSRRICFSSRMDMGKLLPLGHFSIRWSGSLLVPKSGRYIFHFDKDEGLLRFYVDGKMMIDAWTDPIGLPSAGPIELSKGPHKIRIEYFKNRESVSRPNKLKFYWRPEGGPSEIVPAQCLLPQ